MPSSYLFACKFRLLINPKGGVIVGRDFARISEKHGNTRVDTLRETYDEGFAPGVRGDAHLRTVLDRTGARSLSDPLKK